MHERKEFKLDTRYSELLVWVYTVMMFSAGLPAMYMIGFAFTTVTYWVDKVMLLRVNRRPPPYTWQLASKTRRIMLFCLIPHFLIGLMMFTNS